MVDASCTPLTGLTARRPGARLVVIVVILALAYPLILLVAGFPAPAVVALAAATLPPLLALVRRVVARPAVR